MPGIGFTDVNGVAEAVVIFPADRLEPMNKNKSGRTHRILGQGASPIAAALGGGAVRWFKTAVFTFRIRDRL